MCSKIKRERCDDAKFQFTNIYLPPKVFVEVDQKIYELTSPYEKKFIEGKIKQFTGIDEGLVPKMTVRLGDKDNEFRGIVDELYRERFFV